MKRIVSTLVLLSLLTSCFASCGMGKGVFDSNGYGQALSAQDLSYASSAAWDGSASDTSWYTANPNASLFYLADGADLRGFIELVYAASSPVNFAGKTIQLKNSINLGGKDWSIPAVDSYFAGTFDGCGYTIGNFTMNCTSGNQALLGAVGGGAIVKNLNVREGSITLKASSVTSNVGGVISRVITLAGKTVSIEDVCSNCVISQDSTSKEVSAVGGIVGAVSGDGSAVISGCVFEGSVSALNNQIGGIVGYVQDNLVFSALDCTNKGAVTGKEQIGGIVGMFGAFSGNATFQRCVNSGAITILSSSDAGQAGGMVGRYAASTGDLSFSDCRNTGAITYEGDKGGGSWIGGIGGYLVGTDGTINSITLTNCSSTGKIIANRTSAGLVGFVQTCKTLTVSDCWVNAELHFRVNSTKNPYVGGLIGMINLGGTSSMNSYLATLKNCSVTGGLLVTDLGNGKSYTGGLIGALRTTTVQATDCYMDVEFSKTDCEADDVVNVTLGYNQDDAAVLTPSGLSYHHYNEVATPEEYLSLANENAVIKRIGMQYRINEGEDGTRGTEDDTYDLRYVFGVRNLSANDKAIGFDVTVKILGEEVTTKRETVYCPFIYKRINAEGGSIVAEDYNVDYLFTMVISKVPAKEIETAEQGGYTRVYIRNSTIDLVPFTAASADGEKNTGDALIGYGLTPSQLVFQTKHFSGTLPKAFADAEGIFSEKNIAYPVEGNSSCVNATQMGSAEQYVLQENCTCGGACEMNAQGAVAYRINENVPYHYYIDMASYKTHFGETLDTYEAYHRWSFEVEEDGYYEFCFRIRLKGNDGDVENRYALLQIDDQSYGEQTELFYTITVRDGTLRNNKTDQDSYLIGYGAELTKGKHTLTVRLPYSTGGISKSASFHFRDVYLIKGAAQANQAKVPTLDGATLYDGNFDNTATYVLGNTNYDAFIAYGQKLESAGYTLREERSTSYEYLPFDTPNYREGEDNTRENHFRTYTNEDYMIHLYFLEGPKNIRAEVAPVSDYNEYAAVNKPKKYETVTTPLFASLDIGAYSDQGFCFVYRLSDGRFILVDGGQWAEDKPIDDTVKLYNWLKEHADYDGDGNFENNKVVIAAWLITHHHSDHINVAMLFNDLFGDKVEIQNYMYNFPSYEYARSMPNSNVKVEYYTVRFPMMHKMMQNNNTLIARTGFVYYFADCSIEILYTHDDFYPQQINSFNNSSTVFKITLAGKSFLVAGDLEEPGQKVCNKQAGSLLDSDFLQITHHGWNGQVEFYQYIVNEEYDDTIVLWTLPRKENTSQYSKPANKWIKEHMTHIHFGFENRVYDLSRPVGSDVGQLCYTADVPLLDSEQTFNIAENRGKITVLNFWGTWCGPCRSELPDFDRIATEYADEVNVVAIHSNYGKGNAPEYVESNFSGSNIIFGVDEGDTYYTMMGGEGSYPMTWILDADGVVVAKYLGMIHYDILQTQIEAILQG